MPSPTEALRLIGVGRAAAPAWLSSAHRLPACIYSHCCLEVQAGAPGIPGRGPSPAWVGRDGSPLGKGRTHKETWRCGGLFYFRLAATTECHGEMTSEVLPPHGPARQPRPWRALALYSVINSANSQPSSLTTGLSAFAAHYIKFPIKPCQPLRSQISRGACGILPSDFTGRCFLNCF